jgi:hypothetical protein
MARVIADEYEVSLVKAETDALTFVVTWPDEGY